MPVHGAKARHQRHWQVLWPHHPGLVCLHSGAGGGAHCRPARHPVGHQPPLRADLHVEPARHHLHHPGCRGAVRDRCRGAVCRHGPLRQETDPSGLVCRCYASADAQLFWPGCPAAGESCRGQESVLHDGTRLGPDATGRTGHHGHGDRVTSVDNRRVFCDQASDPVGLSAPFANPAHERKGHGPDLFAFCELGPLRSDCAGRRHVSFFQQPGCRLRHCGVHRHADHHRADLLRYSLQLELSVGLVHRGHRVLLCGGLCLLGIQSAQAV